MVTEDPRERRRTDYGVVRRLGTRWEDEDIYGHVNNVVYYSYFDTAVNGYLIEATGTDIRTLEAYGIVAESGCQFLRELRFPLDVEAGLAVTKLGNSSVIYEIGLFQGDAPEPAAVGRFVHVYVTGHEERTVTAIPGEIRAVLEPLLRPER